MRPTMMPRRQTVSNGSAAAAVKTPPSISRTTTSTGQVPVSKFAACFQAILKGQEKPPPYQQDDPERFYFDLFCLGVDKPYLLSLAAEVPDNLLVESGTVKVRPVRFRFQGAVIDALPPEQHTRALLLRCQVHSDKRHRRYTASQRDRGQYGLYIP